MHNVKEITRGILRREGGYTVDHAGPTNHGVTIGTMRALGLDLDGDGDIDAEDVRILSEDQAAEIFEREYFLRPKINRLPARLQASVYDMFVNAGANAIEILQELITAAGIKVTEDGALGPQTLGAAEVLDQVAGDDFADAYGIARRHYYYGLGDQVPKFRKYARRRDGGKGGWITRAEEFISPALHLTEAQHKERVSKW